jgi:hypothetical protein
MQTRAMSRSPSFSQSESFTASRFTRSQFFLESNHFQGTPELANSEFLRDSMSLLSSSRLAETRTIPLKLLSLSNLRTSSKLFTNSISL